MSDDKKSVFDPPPLRTEGALQDYDTGRVITDPEEISAWNLRDKWDDRDRLTFSSGRTLYAHCRIIGIDAEFGLSEGYDGDISWPPWIDPNGDNSNKLTADDMRELADLMIDRWIRFKDSLGVDE